MQYILQPVNEFNNSDTLGLNTLVLNKEELNRLFKVKE